MGKEILTRFIAIVLVTVAGLLPVSCKKKDRLGADTATLTITPPAATALRGESLELSSYILYPNGAKKRVSADWAVSGACAQNNNLDLDVTTGDLVVFTVPNSLCDVEITATSEGKSSIARVAIVAYKSAASIFEVYSDALPNLPNTNIYVFPQAATFLAESSIGYTPQGLKYQRATDTSTGNAWGISHNFTPGLLTSVDLSDYHPAVAKLKFFIRLHRQLAGEIIRVEIEYLDNSDIARKAAVNSLSADMLGFNASNTDWQEVSIVLDDFVTGSPPINYARIIVPFGIVMQFLGSPLTFDIDAVRWEPQ
jgi:hypothetical protein